MNRLAFLAVVYAGAALFITAFWTYSATTEHYKNRFNSIVAIADGSAPAPFVKRRLAGDLGRGLAAVVPAQCWQAVTAAVADRPALAEVLHGRLRWRPQDYPVLLATTLLIWLSVVGFMFCCRWIARTVYEMPPWLGDLVGLAFGAALLGAGEAHRVYQWYPYDYPNAFVFALVLGAQLARRPWMLAAFAFAAYSKETSLLLIVSYVLLAPERRSRGFWATLSAMSAMFLACRLWLALHYDNPPGADFWYPTRNALMVLRHLCLDFWPLPLLGVALWRFAAHWPRFPASLRKLLLLAVIQAGCSFFKGWLEEKRQYLELLPVGGLLMLQWVLMESGFGRLMTPREQALDEPAETAFGERVVVQDIRRTPEPRNDEAVGNACRLA